MLKVKLMPFGRKKLKHYRIVVAEEHSKITGSPVAKLGHFNPLKNDLVLDKKVVRDWVKKGAQVTTAVAKLLEK
jgi:small subunit ribosomal protein S16